MSTLQLRAADGNVLSAYLVKPAGPLRGAVVVIQEIFGVNSHIRRVAEQYAAEGYLTVAPAMFDRLQKGIELGYGEPDIEAGRALMSKTTPEGVLADVNAAIGAVARAGKVGMVGFCWGGRATYLSACRTNIAAGVAYYGGGIAQLLPETPRCPVMFHFGEKDAHIPLADIERIREAYPQGEYHVYTAGHGFNCTDRAAFEPASARLAFERSVDFLRRYVG
jgi:carboxymethylenebutenolidase